MKISITDFNDNISKYINIARTEDLFLQKRGITVAVIISPEKWKDMEAVIDYVNSKDES